MLRDERPAVGGREGNSKEARGRGRDVEHRPAGPAKAGFVGALW
jgi:hypothetical protein